MSVFFRSLRPLMFIPLSASTSLMAASLNPDWPAPASIAHLQAIRDASLAQANEPEAVFYEADLRTTGWYRPYHAPLNAKNVRDYEFNNEPRPDGELTRSDSAVRITEDGMLEITGSSRHQSGILLPPELWQEAPGDQFVLGLEMELTDLKMRGYYLSPQISQGGGRGTQRFLAEPITPLKRIEFIASKNDTPITVGHRGNEGVWKIRRLYLRPATTDDRVSVESATTQPLDITIDPDRSLPTNPLLFGISPNLFSGGHGFDSPDVRTALETMGIRALRFPTGTQSNWYEWENDGWPAPEDLPKGIPAFVANSTKAMRETRGAKYGLADYQKLVRELNITPVLVLNILTSTPESQAALAAHMKEAGAPVTHFELGNETYHHAQANAETETARQYLAHVKPFAEAVRGVVADAEFALPVESRITRNDDFEWNKTLATADFADGAVQHTYTMMFGIPFNREMTAALLHPEVQLADKVLLKRDQFPEDWKVWNTEWGVNAPPAFPYGSQAGALQTVGYLLALIDWQSDYELATLHCLSNGEFSPIELQPNGPTLLKRPYFAFVLAAPLFADSTTWLGTTSAGDDNTTLPLHPARAYRAADGTLGTVIINRTPHPTPLGTLTLAGEPLAARGTVHSLSADSLADRSTVKMGETMIVTSELSESTTLPPFSINRIEFAE